MPRISRLFAAAVFLFISANVWSQANTEPKAIPQKDAIIGHWEMIKSDSAKPATVVEFTKEEKILLSIEINAEKVNVAGKYKVVDDTITIIAIKDGKEIPEENKIKVLTGNKLVLVDSKGKEIEFKRLVEEKKK